MTTSQMSENWRDPYEALDLKRYLDGQVRARNPKHPLPREFSPACSRSSRKGPVTPSLGPYYSNPVNTPMPKQKQTAPEPPPKVSFFRKFRMEILALFLFGAGIFLLLERLEIKQVLYGECIWLLSIFRDVASHFVSAATGIKQSNIAGLILIALAVWVMGARFRFRMIQRHPSLDADSPCPNCGVDLTRIHRTRRHRLLQRVFFVRITRCVCKKCEFTATLWAGRQD